MDRRRASNDIPVAPWMTRLVAKQPEGNYTPDQIAKSLELAIAMNNGDPAKVRASLHKLALKAPAAHQPYIRKLDHRSDEQMLKQVQAFIDITNEKLALLLKEVPSDPEQEVSIEPRRESGLSSGDSAWGDDWDRSSRSKPRSRGHRAVRAAKRKQAEAGD